VFGYLFGPPGWLPDGNGATTENLRRRAMLLAADTTTSPLSNARGGDENAKAMIVDSGGLAR